MLRVGHEMGQRPLQSQLRLSGAMEEGRAGADPTAIVYHCIRALVRQQDVWWGRKGPRWPCTAGKVCWRHKCVRQVAVKLSCAVSGAVDSPPTLNWLPSRTT